MKTQDAPNLLDRAKQKIKRLEDALEQAEAENKRLKEALVQIEAHGIVGTLNAGYKCSSIAEQTLKAKEGNQ